MINRNLSIPIYIQIQKILQEGIREGRILAGEKIPSEQELANQYSVSRMTARKAVNDLVAQGILIRRQGKGTFVADNVMSYGLSSMLSFSRTLQAQGHKITTKVLRQEIVRSPKQVADALRLAEDSEVVVIKRLRRVDNICAAIHTLYLDLRYKPILKAELSSESLLVALEELKTDTEVYSIDRVRAILVEKDDAALLEIPSGSPVLNVTGTTFNSGGNPVRYIRAVYRGDFFDLEVKNTRDQTTSISISNSPEELDAILIN